MAKKKTTRKTSPKKDTSKKEEVEIVEIPKEELRSDVQPPMLKVKFLHPKAHMPALATEGSAGYDLVAVETSVNHPQNGKLASTFTYKFGLAIEIPKGYVGLLFPRSSVIATGMTLANSVGVIDSDYRGELKAVFIGSLQSQRYVPGERVAQLVILPLAPLPLKKVDKLGETTRGAGGFGSTGKHGNKGTT